MMMAVSFQRSGRLYYLDPGPYQPTVGTKVLVPTDAGPEVAECIWAPQWVDDEISGLPVCAGLADRAGPEPGRGQPGAPRPRPGSLPGGWSASTSCR